MNFIAGISINIQNVKTTVWCVVAGVIISLFITFFNKSVIGALVRALIDSDAFSPENAKTPSELGIRKNSPVYSSLKRSESLRKIIKTADPTAAPDENTKVYIDPEQKTRAEEQYLMRPHEGLAMIIGAVVAIAIGFVISVYLH